MLKPICEITITSADGANKWQFNAVHSCAITEDTNTLTDICTLEVPKKTVWEGAPVGAGANPPIKRGDKIIVKLGFDGVLKQRFAGYIRNVGNKMPVKIECEDGMFLLKLSAIKKEGFKSISLQGLMEKILAGTGVKFKLIDADINIGSYRITQSTVAEELNEMKKELGLMAYFRSYNDEQFLYVGFTYPFDSVNKQGFFFGNNIVEEQFEYKRKEDIKLKVKAISIGKDNKRIDVTEGDKDGEEITVYSYGLTKDALRIFAKQSIDRYKYTGLKGNFKTFGEPAMKKTDKAYLESEDGNKGTYLCKKVDVLFDMSGFWQTIELGQIISNG